MRKSPVRDLTLAAMVAALYAVLSYFSNIFGLAYGPIQFRFSEALCVLPFLFPATAPGLFVGCLIANLLSPYGAMDIVVGSLATLIAAVWTSKVRHWWMAWLPPVLCNAIIVGLVLTYAYGIDMLWMNMLTVGLGEAVVCYVLGVPMIKLLSRQDLSRWQA